jgi:hypothetical protein
MFSYFHVMGTLKIDNTFFKNIIADDRVGAMAELRTQDFFYIMPKLLPVFTCDVIGDDSRETFFFCSLLFVIANLVIFHY